MSVRQEHRYRKLVISQGRVATDRQREAEAACMVRGPRPAVVPPPPNHARRQVRSWMRRNAEGFETATELAEAANAALLMPPEAMDDEGHWVWEEALSALEWVAPNAELRPTGAGLSRQVEP